MLTQHITQLLQPSPPQSTPISGDVYNRLFHGLDSTLLHCTDTAKTYLVSFTPRRNPCSQHRKVYLPTALKIPYTHHLTNMQLSNAVFRLLVKSTQGKLSIEELLSRGKITHYYAAFPNSISVPSSTALIESDLMPTVLANVIEHKRGMNTTLQMQHSKHARKEARHLQILLRSSKAKRHKRVFNAGSQTTDTGTIFMSAIQQPLLGIVTDAKRILEGVDFSQRLLNTQSVPSHLACTPPFQARAPRQTLRAEPPLPDPIKIARRGTGGYQQWHPC